MLVSTAAILHDPADNEPPDSDKKSAFLHNTSFLERNSRMCPVPPRGVLKGLKTSFAAAILRDPLETNQMTTERKEGGFLRQIRSLLFHPISKARFASFLGMRFVAFMPTPRITFVG